MLEFGNNLYRVTGQPGLYSESLSQKTVLVIYEFNRLVIKFSEATQLKNRENADLDSKTHVLVGCIIICL